MRTAGIFLVGLCFYMAFSWAMPITDPVESNYALTAKEMLQSGDWLSPRIYGQVWFDKPALIYWMLLISYKLFGVTDFAARLPSAVFSAASLALVDWFVRALGYGRRTGLQAALILASMLEFWLLAHMVITDAALFFFHSLALCSFFLALVRRSAALACIGWIACGFAVLTKGPIGLLLPGFTMCVYLLLDRKMLANSLVVFRPFNLAMFLVVALPWYIWMSVHYGDAFINTFLGLHNYVRATVSEHPKDNVWYYYFVLYPVSLLPWTGLLFAGRKAAVLLVRSQQVFLCVVIGVTIGFYSLMATKYPTYIFPVLFFTAVLLALLCQKRQERGLTIHPMLLGVPILLFLVGAETAVYKLHLTVDAFFYLLQLAALAVTLLLFRKKNAAWRVEGTATAMLLVMLVLMGYVFTPITQSRSAKAVMSFVPASAKVVAVSDYSTSAVYYSGKEIVQLVDNPETHEGVWAGKYTMPRQTIAQYTASLQPDDEVYILVKTLRAEAVTQDSRLAAQCALAFEADGYRLYRWRPF